MPSDRRWVSLAHPWYLVQCAWAMPRCLRLVAALVPALVLKEVGMEICEDLILIETTMPWFYSQPAGLVTDEQSNGSFRSLEAC